MRRLLLLALVAIPLAPGTWVRTPAPEPNDSQVLTLTPLRAVPRALGEAMLEGAWRLTSANSDFGSYSALILLDANRFLAGSDRGQLLEFDRPDADAHRRESLLRMFPGTANRDKSAVDLESLTFRSRHRAHLGGVRRTQRHSTRRARSHRTQGGVPEGDGGLDQQFGRGKSGQAGGWTFPGHFGGRRSR